MRPFIFSIILIFLASCQEQKRDSSFDAQVAHPAYPTNGPRVLFDQAHRNIHSIRGNFRPFYDLLTSDGYVVTTNEKMFTGDMLKGTDVLVVVNAKGEKHKYDPAFSLKECIAVEEWVRGGGNLLLVADHYPFGSASKELAGCFGVTMTGGFANDSVYFDSTSATQSSVNGKSQLVFTRTDGQIGDCPITKGRDSSEQINRVVTFTGQSLRGPAESNAFLILSPYAYNVTPDSIWEEPEMIFLTKTVTRFAEPSSAAGMSQGLSLEYGKGRVVVLGEAAMLTAQLYGKEKFGMQVPGTDDRQLALNIMHWLSRKL